MFEDFMNVDMYIRVTGTLNDENILTSVSQAEDGSEGDGKGEEGDEEPTVTAKEAKHALNLLQIFLEKSTNKY